MENLHSKTILRMILALSALLPAGALYLAFQPGGEGAQILVAAMGKVIIAFLSAQALLAALLLVVTMWAAPRLLAWLQAGFAALQRLKAANLVLFAGVVGLLVFLLIGPYGNFFRDFLLRLVLFWSISLFGAVCLKACGVQAGWPEVWGAAVLALAVVLRLSGFLAEISTYPFTLSWSEASRYYYASLFFSERVYGIAVPPSVLHPSRYLMQSLPFLLSTSPLWLHRLWQVVLWVVTTSACSLLLARRLSIGERLHRTMLVAWAFLFLLLGPVYYHLQVPLILVLAFYNRRRPWQTLGAILLASAWAGISRINWYPVPGMLAAMLFFLEEPAGKRSLWRYLWKPAFWTILGTGVAFATQAAYVVLSDNPTQHFTSAFSSDLLWYRLLPSPTYPLGVFPAVVLACAPLLLALGARMSARWQARRPIRWLGLGGILLVLLAGGLVVSAKIGGGSNLHNLDAFLALLLVGAVHLFFDKFIPETEIEPAGEFPAISSNRQRLLVAGVALSVLLPVYFAVLSPSKLLNYDRQETARVLERLERFVSEAAQDGGRVLFISERQLLTFHMLPGVELVPDYEKVFLTEMAMAGDPDYLGQFWDDLKNQRFAMIVTEPLFVRYKGRAESFGEENDAWVKNVSEKVLCSYAPQKFLREVPLQLLAPREQRKDCP